MKPNKDIQFCIKCGTVYNKYKVTKEIPESFGDRRGNCPTCKKEIFIWKEVSE